MAAGRKYGNQIPNPYAIQVQVGLGGGIKSVLARGAVLLYGPSLVYYVAASYGQADGTAGEPGTFAAPMRVGGQARSVTLTPAP